MISECKKQYNRSYFIRNKERLIAYRKKYYISNKEEIGRKSKEKYNRIKHFLKETYDVRIDRRFAQGKNQARIRGLDWELTFEEYEGLAETPCFYCLNRLGHKLRGVGLDRINNEKGYTRENVLPCCGVCNRIRSNVLTVDEAKIAIVAILEFRTKERLNVAI